VYEVDKRHGRVAWPDEVGVQRVDRPVVGHRAAGRHQRLACHLTAEHALPALTLRAAAAEDVELDLLKIKQLNHGIKSLGHCRSLRLAAAEPMSARNLDGLRAPRPPGSLAAAQDSKSRSLALVKPT